jgi:hypothetical protein
MHRSSATQAAPAARNALRRAAALTAKRNDKTKRDARRRECAGRGVSQVPTNRRDMQSEKAGCTAIDGWSTQSSAKLTTNLGVLRSGTFFGRLRLGRSADKDSGQHAARGHRRSHRKRVTDATSGACKAPPDRRKYASCVEGEHEFVRDWVDRRNRETRLRNLYLGAEAGEVKANPIAATALCIAQTPLQATSSVKRTTSI